MNLRLRKVWRDLWVNKARTFLVVLSIAVGVFALGMVFSTRLMLSQDLNAGYVATTPASAILFMDEFDEELVQTVRRMDRVLDAEGRRNISVRLKVGPDSWQDTLLEAFQDYGDLRLNRIKPESGAWPPSEQTMLIERSALGVSKAQVGDVVQIKTENDTLREMSIVGLVHDMNKVPATFDGRVYGYITFDMLEWLGYSRRFNELHILVDSEDKSEIKQIAEQVQSKVEKAGHTVSWLWVPTPGKHAADDIVQPLLTILGVLGVLSLMLSTVLVVNTISAILTQQTRQIGIMKGIGASSGQIAVLYLLTILIFALFSLLVAVPLAGLAAIGFTSYLAQLLNFDLMGWRIPSETLLLQLVTGLMVPLLAALWPIFDGTRTTVREAMTNLGSSQSFGRGRVDQLLEKIRFLPGSVLLSLRNTFRRKARLALTLFTLTLAGAIFITVFSVQASLHLALEEFSAYWNYDVLVEFSRPYRTEQISREIMRVPTVISVESWGNVNTNRMYPDGRQGNSVKLFAPPAESTMIQPLLVAGRWLEPDDENAIVVDTDFLEKEPDIEIGDSITLKWFRRESEWLVVGIVKPSLSGTGLRFGSLYINYPQYAQASRLTGRANSARVVTTQHEPEAQLQTAVALEKHFNNTGLNVSSIRTSSSLRDGASLQFNVLIATLSVMAGMLTVVGGLGLMNTMSINVLERTREIGMMRAIGASDWTVLRIFIVEGILIGAMSWPLGVLLALPISKLLAYWVGILFTRSPLTHTLPWRGMGLWLLLVLLLTTLASFLPARRAASLTVRKVLTQE